MFLDEIGELDAAIQVKLLRVLETRRFQRVGSTDTLTFKGKIIAATNRDLQKEMEAGRFRHDLYFRLCADQVTTPSLAEQLSDRPDDLEDLVRFAVGGALDLDPDSVNDPAKEVEQVTTEVLAWIRSHLGDSYVWPGNFRELGQCVRNVIVRGRYLPPSRGNRTDRLGPVEELLAQVREATATSDELLGRYYAAGPPRVRRELQGGRPAAECGLEKRQGWARPRFLRQAQASAESLTVVGFVWLCLRFVRRMGLPLIRPSGTFSPEGRRGRTDPSEWVPKSFPPRGKVARRAG